MMDIQQRSSALSLMHRDFSSFSKSFDDVMHLKMSCFFQSFDVPVPTFFRPVAGIKFERSSFS